MTSGCSDSDPGTTIRQRTAGGRRTLSPWDRRARTSRCLGLLLLLASACLDRALGETNAVAQPDELEVKAAFVMNFLRLVNWEPVAGEQNPRILPVCAFANSDFATAVRYAAKGKSVGSRLIVFKVQPDPDPAQCRVLLVDSTQYYQAPAVLKSHSHDPMLTIGNGAGFVEVGGMFELLVQDRRVQFNTNLAAVRSSKLDVSARLLNLARNLRKGANGGD
ncbi:YfiR family protein [uncultured Paludibaculum sp.]|uniref:YfiR family protein n=1 Tax=uncultured Paludibaculum sp. TaxID=1765020 RepID=UPI002AAB452A|nr:YfiR family protein [uncultured Paludibaculum sp.]